MKKASLLVCAGGGLLLVLAGCSSTDIAGLLLVKNEGANGDRVVVGSVQAVAESTQASLMALGLAATLTEDGGAIYIASSTKSGERFRIVLTREQTQQGERTRIHLEWQGRANDKSGPQILAHVEATHNNKR